MMILWYLIGIISGVAASAQVSFNNEIRRRTGSPYITAAIGFIAALSLMLIILLVTEGGVAIPFRQIARYPFWIWTGGACGVVVVMAGIFCLPVLGSARNILILCFGQIMAGLIIDHFGLFDAPVTGMTALRAIGAVIAIAGITLISVEKDELKKEADGTGRAAGTAGRVLLFIVFDLIAGGIAAIQVAVNGTLANVAGSPMRATLISMSVALLTTLFISMVLAAVRGRAAVYDRGSVPVPRTKFSLILLTGGSMAVVVVGGNAITGPLLGTGVVTMMNLLGMMASGLIIDATGFMGIEKKPVKAVKLAGMLLMLAGTAMISL